jgi:hypothetical protein
MLFQVILAIFTFAAGIDQTTDPNRISDFEFVDMVADLGDPSDYFVTGYQGKEGHTPVVSDKMQIGMTNTAIQNFHQHIVRAWLSPVKIKRNESPGSGHCSVPF